MRRAIGGMLVIVACAVPARADRARVGPALQVRVIDPAATAGPYDLFRRTHVRHLLGGRAMSVSALPIVLEPGVVEASAMEVGVEDAQPLPPVAGAPFAGPSIALSEGDVVLASESDLVATAIHETVGDRALDAVLVALGRNAAAQETLGPSLTRALALAGDRPLIVGAAIARDGCDEVAIPDGLRCTIDVRGRTGARGDACDCQGVFVSESAVASWWQEHAVWPLREELGVELAGWALTLRATPVPARDRARALGDPR